MPYAAQTRNYLLVTALHGWGLYESLRVGAVLRTSPLPWWAEIKREMLVLIKDLMFEKGGVI